MWKKASLRKQLPPSKSEELTCTLLIAQYICGVGLFGIHSLTCSSFKTQVCSIWILGRKKIPHPKITMNSVRDLTIVKVSKFIITQNIWWTWNKDQRSGPSIEKRDPRISRWVRWVRRSEHDWDRRRVEAEWDPRDFIRVILWKCPFSTYKRGWICVYWWICKFQLNVHESRTWCPAPREHPGFNGEYLEDTQKLGNLNGLACLSSIFLEALDEKAGRAMPMPKASDKQEKREAKADDRIHISKDNLSTRKLLQ